MKTYLECKYAGCCNNGCDYMLKAEAEEYARRIYVSAFNEESNDRNKLNEVYKKIPEMIMKYKGGSTSTKLECCTKVHFLRKIIYNTKIPFSKIAAAKTISSEFNK